MVRIKYVSLAMQIKHEQKLRKEEDVMDITA